MSCLKFAATLKNLLQATMIFLNNFLQSPSSTVMDMPDTRFITSPSLRSRRKKWLTELFKLLENPQEILSLHVSSSWITPITSWKAWFTVFDVQAFIIHIKVLIKSNDYFKCEKTVLTLINLRGGEPSPTIIYFTTF